MACRWLLGPLRINTRRKITLAETASTTKMRLLNDTTYIVKHCWIKNRIDIFNQKIKE